jgi:hypothetical protein
MGYLEPDRRQLMKHGISPIQLLLLSVIASVALMVWGCTGDDDQSQPRTPEQNSSTVTPKAESTATVAPTLEREVIEDYMDYVEGYKKALLDLDIRQVEAFASGDELQSIRQEIEKLRAQGVALRVVVTHNPVVAQISGNSAVIVDEMVNNSFYVNAQTKEPPVASGSGEVLRNSFRLEKARERWVVTQVTRQQ